MGGQIGKTKTAKSFMAKVEKEAMIKVSTWGLYCGRRDDIIIAIMLKF